MVTLTREIPNRASGPEKVFNKCLFPSPPVKSKRAPLTRPGLFRPGGCRDSSCRSVCLWLQERIWGMDNESAPFRFGPRPRDSEPTEVISLPRKRRHTWAQHLLPTDPKAKDKAVLGKPPGLEIPIQVMFIYAIFPSPEKPSLTEQGQPSSVGTCRALCDVFPHPLLYAHKKPLR